MRAVLWLILLAFGVADLASARDTYTFHNPKVDGYPLDACKSRFGGCGKEAADYFCRRKNYIKAKDYQIVDYQGVTKMLKSRQTCTANCYRFKYIVCRKPSYFTYYYPKHKGIPVDWCYYRGRGCGKKAADAYCVSRGHKKAARDFTIRRGINHTITLGSNSECTGEHCKSFTYIRCRKSSPNTSTQNAPKIKVKGVPRFYDQKLRQIEKMVGE